LTGSLRSTRQSHPGVREAGPGRKAAAQARSSARQSSSRSLSQNRLPGGAHPSPRTNTGADN